MTTLGKVEGTGSVRVNIWVGIPEGNAFPPVGVAWARAANTSEGAPMWLKTGSGTGIWTFTAFSLWHCTGHATKSGRGVPFLD